jgi:hypothetical protein
MQHDELIDQGIEDIFSGNESYAGRYMQGQLYAHDAISFSHLSGNEGFVGAIWEKIKQFCTWLAGLFTGKKGTGEAAREVGAKTNLPKPTKETIKVTPVPVSKLKKSEKAPKTHAPTPEQKKSDRVTMKVESFHEQLDRAVKELKEEAGEQKEVTLVEVPTNMDGMFQNLNTVGNDLKAALDRLGGSYVITYGMVNAIKDDVPADVWRNIRTPEPTQVLKPFEDIKKRLTKFAPSAAEKEAMTRDKVMSVADHDVTGVCQAIIAAVEKVRIFTDTHAANNDVEKKEFIEKRFKTRIEKVDGKRQGQFASLLFRMGKWDYDCYCLLELADSFARIKQRIYKGDYLVRAPQA